ncbi:MAG: prepilin-type N-terminal cleavage/methylation domain-containing protein [Pseudomonadota bacterium]
MIRRSRAITLVELMVTLTILATLLSIGIVSIRGYLPKQRLITSAQALSAAFQKAQTEATTRSLWVCVLLDSTTNTITTYLDKAGTGHTSAVGCGGSGQERIGETVNLRNGISFSACSSWYPRTVWFDQFGRPNFCSGATCTSIGVEIVLSATELASGSKAREVEVTIGGFVQIVKPGLVGLVPYYWANAPGAPTGSNSCE